MFFLKLAVLNITRNPKRSLITITAITLGLSAIIFLWAFVDGYQDEQRENAIRTFSGHVQIQSKGFKLKPKPKMVLKNKEEIQKCIASFRKPVEVTDRAFFEALLGTTENTTGVYVYGIDPIREKKVMDTYKLIKKGKFLTSEDHRSIILGASLAEKMGLELGDKVVLMTQSAEEMLSGFPYRLKGILDTGTDTDEFIVFITLHSAQELLGIGEQFHTVVVRLPDRSSIPLFLKNFRDLPNAEAYEILTWDKLIPQIDQWANWTGAIISIIMIVVMAVIGIGVMNTILMSILERTKELGVMMAIGTTPRQIVLMVFIETLTIVWCGMVLGIILGYLLVAYFGHFGIHFQGFEAAARQAFMNPVVYPKLYFYRIVNSVVGLLIITSLVGFYPAWKASRLEPVKAIYHS